MTDKDIEEMRETIAKKMAESSPLYDDESWEGESLEYKEAWRESADDFLSLKVGSLRLAIVDDKAELPAVPDPPLYSDKPYGDIEKQAFRVGALTYRNSVLKAGYVKEVKK